MRLLWIALLCLAAVAAVAQERALDELLRETSRLIAAKQLRAAEIVAREAVERHPDSREARSTLAWLTLWNGRYDEARARFQELVQHDTRDASALLGLAQSSYWSGDLRTAERQFTEVLRLAPDHAEALVALRDIRAGARPGYDARLDSIRDDQPYRANALRTTFYAFTDPLTKWSISAGAASFNSELADGRSVDAGAGVETTRNRLTLRASAAALRFPDDALRILPRIEVLRPAGSTTIAVVAERRELLRAAPALRTHPTVTSYMARWSRERQGQPQFALRAETLRYFDGNRGVAADAYLLVPIGRAAIGASAAWRDTGQSRFDGARYDPYYTPQRLLEARLVAQTSWQMKRATVALHVDGGIARDELYGIARRFHPWSGAVTASVPFTPRLTFRVRAEHQSTIYYESNELSTGVAGRF